MENAVAASTPQVGTARTASISSDGSFVQVSANEADPTIALEVAPAGNDSIQYDNSANDGARTSTSDDDDAPDHGSLIDETLLPSHEEPPAEALARTSRAVQTSEEHQSSGIKSWHLGMVTLVSGGVGLLGGVAIGASAKHDRDQYTSTSPQQLDNAALTAQASLLAGGASL